MNAYFVRTRLQCLIAMNIQKKMPRNERYAVVFLYQNSREEDSAAVYALYERFEEGSSLAFHLVARDGFLGFLFKVFIVMNLTAVSRGACYLASIDSLPFALVLRICPWVRLETFDDGAANILPTSKYFRGRSFVSSGWRNFLIDTLFAEGWISWMRQRTKLHHTVFPFGDNIVGSSRLKILSWDWDSLLVPADIEILDGNISTIVLGTCSSDFPSSEAVKEASCELALMSDLYIAHPRENPIPEARKAVYLQSPAEAVLLYLAKSNRITVLHFNSTVAYTLNGESNIVFRNLIDPTTFEIIEDISKVKNLRSLRESMCNADAPASRSSS